MRVKHVTFNPQWGGLQLILENAEEDGWMLSHIVPSTQYQAVAVLVKPESPGVEDEESEVVFENPVPENGSYL